MLRPVFKTNCESCGKEMDAQSKTKRKCFDCKQKRRILYSQNLYKKNKQYKCITCPDKSFNLVDEPNTSCGFCKSITNVKKNTI